MACNNSGRPSNKNVIKFSQQPPSIISRLLKKIKENECPLPNIDLEQGSKDFTDSMKSPPNVDFLDIDQQDSCLLCQVCSHISSNMKEYQKHSKIHKEKQFSCDYPNCVYTSKLSSNLVKHKRIHTSEKPYLCDQCSFRSNFINSLKVHKRIHSDERPYSCNHCSYRCNSSSNLKKHCRHRHWDITQN
ncbi:zinc finger protein 271-like [Plodia interpunctella]|uniref:zinc finger protein 271-like n=1 Tax=Plodia interpunctella TaxID=58824 RepID=UPI002367F592|nr:zinc finger protein 271-like [Plodia interpunctella]